LLAEIICKTKVMMPRLQLLLRVRDVAQSFATVKICSHVEGLVALLFPS